MAYNRDRNSSGGDRGGFRSRPSFGGRSNFSSNRPRFNDRGPVEMFQAVCDNCGKNCEVPFRPTQGKPIFCSDCFRNQKDGGDSRRNDRPNFDNRQNEDRPQPKQEQSSSTDQFKAINAKLDSILKILEEVTEGDEEEMVEEIDQPVKEIVVEKKKKAPKKAIKSVTPE